jgi:hypothetical protein
MQFQPATWSKECADDQANTLSERTIIGDLKPQLQSWFADTVAEAIPENMIAIIRQMDTELPAESRSLAA